MFRVFQGAGRSLRLFTGVLPPARRGPRGLRVGRCRPAHISARAGRAVARGARAGGQGGRGARATRGRGPGPGPGPDDPGARAGARGGVRAGSCKAIALQTYVIMFDKLI